ncbi:MAG: hypothetical protein R3314_01680 [Longimicrobiales bacterium]|nr:hypothetical protein [Longimicrobiales bacterium]
MGHDEIEWTEEEREALDRLPREADPGRLLEERTVAALKERGLLEGGRRSRTDRIVGRPGLGPFHPAWWAAAIAAGLALFLGGLALGQARSGITADDLMTALRSAETAERPTLIQQTGSLYVDALASLAADSPDRETVGTGVEVGITALYAAAYELARLHPEDPRLRLVIQALESRPTNGDPETDVHWF